MIFQSSLVNKLVIPVILAVIISIAGIFAFMPIDKAITVHSTLHSAADATTQVGTIQGTQLEILEDVSTGSGDAAGDIDQSGDITCTLSNPAKASIYLDASTLDDGDGVESMVIDEIKVDGEQIGSNNAFYAAHVLDLINLSNGTTFDADIDGAADIIMIVNGMTFDDTIEIEFTAFGLETDGGDDLAIIAFFETIQGSTATCVWTNG